VVICVQHMKLYRPLCIFEQLKKFNIKFTKRRESVLNCSDVLKLLLDRYLGILFSSIPGDSQTIQTLKKFKHI
jgi:hypothetical protein